MRWVCIWLALALPGYGQTLTNLTLKLPGQSFQEIPCLNCPVGSGSSTTIVNNAVGGVTNTDGTITVTGKPGSTQVVSAVQTSTNGLVGSLLATNAPAGKPANAGSGVWTVGTGQTFRVLSPTNAALGTLSLDGNGVLSYGTNQAAVVTSYSQSSYSTSSTNIVSLPSNCGSFTNFGYSITFTPTNATTQISGTFSVMQNSSSSEGEVVLCVLIDSNAVPNMIFPSQQDSGGVTKTGWTVNFTVLTNLSTLVSHTIAVGAQLCSGAGFNFINGPSLSLFGTTNNTASWLVVRN